MVRKLTGFIVLILLSILDVQQVHSAKGPIIDLESQPDTVVPFKEVRNGIQKTKRWTNGIIPYEMEKDWEIGQLAIITQAMATIENNTCIRFVRRTNEPNYVTIKNTKGCHSSNVGMRGGAQSISLQDDKDGSCMVLKTIMHEMLHCIGLWHEHCRHDRDDYIIVHWENVPNSTAYRHQFRKLSETESKIYGIPYNYLSIMHYKYNAFSVNGEVVMEPKDASMLKRIGGSAGAHELDWEKVRRIYECNPPATEKPSGEE